MRAMTKRPNLYRRTPQSIAARPGGFGHLPEWLASTDAVAECGKSWTATCSSRSCIQDPDEGRPPR